MWLSAIGVMLTLALLWAPLAAKAQQPGKVYRIVFLSAYAPPLPSEPTPILDAFRQQLHALGWMEGQNMVIEHRWAEMRFDRLPALATELVQQQVDLILVGDGAAIVAAKQTTSTIPIVMFFSVDAVRQGFVASLAHPGANVTGLTSTNMDLSSKRLELLKEMVPGSSRMAILQCKAVSGQNYPGGQGVEEMQVTARALGIQLQLLEVREPEDYQGAFAAAISERAEAMLVSPCYYNGVNSQRIVDLAAQHRLPTIYNTRTPVQAGGLMSYGASRPAMARRAATYVDKILKGAKPADLPVEQPMTFELILNLKTAQALGITILPTLLILADEVIQ